MALNRARTGLAIRTMRGIEALSFLEFPIFLCPAIAQQSIFPRRFPLDQTPNHRIPACRAQKRRLHSATQSTPDSSIHIPAQSLGRLPQHCPGCGAVSQTVFGNEPGYYSLTRRSVKTYLAGTVGIEVGESSAEEQAAKASSAGVDDVVLKTFGLENHLPQSRSTTSPVCDRCHKLVHHHLGESIHHPSIQSIQDTIAESPHKYNHLYHVLDAADFPMSLIPRLNRLLDIAPLRSLNRRSKSGAYVHGKKTEISFVITRSDLLAPLKAQVDSLMPYFTDVLRDALGSFGKGVRLGNIRCVSAKRGWWTKELKEDIWKRGGGGWMLGKVNVGKSQLFESVFPKGRQNALTSAFSLDLPFPKFRTFVPVDVTTSDQSVAQEDKKPQEDSLVEPSTDALNTWSLLPPAPAETNYPQMPLVSPLPGTTASPIRVPFGNGRGELIDLPGLSRGDIELYVQEAHRASLVMKSRVVPEQQVIKPGHSLLLGGFIRITPTTPDVIVLAYAFTPISPHLTSTEKAIAIQTQSRETGVENIANPGVGEKIVSAGKFQLKWDVTKKRTGPITDPSAAGIKVERLPYRVLSIDILVEGCGWVELVAQVRTRKLEIPSQQESVQGGQYEGNPLATHPQWPEVEVFSPEGKFIASRRPLGAWVMGGPKKGAAAQKGRPRRSMKGEKKKAKALRRAIEAQST